MRDDSFPQCGSVRRVHKSAYNKTPCQHHNCDLIFWFAFAWESHAKAIYHSITMKANISLDSISGENDP